MGKTLLISKGKLQVKYLSGKTALITGAGGGIGFQTARSLIWLGVKVIIVEIDKTKGKDAEKALNNEFGNGSALFIHTDIGNLRSVKKLVRSINKIDVNIDIIINNATITHVGKVHETNINIWDSSYKTNLRGPILILHNFLPHMLKRNEGIIVFVSSSGAAPCIGPYEVFKTSQVELGNTLVSELEGTNIITYSIAPGLVKTNTAIKTIEKIAPYYNKSVEDSTI